jgi:hypothetical protein
LVVVKRSGLTAQLRFVGGAGSKKTQKQQSYSVTTQFGNNFEQKRLH